MADPTAPLYAIVGAIHVALAIGLLGLNFGDRLNRAFAFYLALIGGAMIVTPIPTDTSWQRGLHGLFWYLNLGSAFPLLYLAACYRDRFSGRGRRTAALVGLVALAVLVEGLFILNPGLVIGTGFRPLKAFHFALVLLGPAILAALLVRDAFRATTPHGRRHLLLASLGFAFYPAAFGLHLFVPNLMSIPIVDAWIGILGLAPAAYVFARLARAARGTDDPALGRSARKYLLILTLSPLSVLGLFWAEAALPLADAKVVMRFVMTGWLVVMMLLVAYAILRHQLFGIEIGVKWTIRRGMVPGLIVAVFFVVSELIESLADQLAGAKSWMLAGVVVGLMAVGYYPLQRMADRFANAAMPEIADTPQYRHKRTLQLFESALAAAWEDGSLTRAERLHLDRLRDRLKIPAAEAGAMEREVMRRLMGRKTDS